MTKDETGENWPFARVEGEKRSPGELEPLGRFAELAGDGYTRVGADERIVSANAALCERLGYGRAEMVGRPFLDFVWPADRDQVRERRREPSRRRQGERYEARLLTQAAEPLRVLVTDIVLTENGAYAGTSTVVTPRDVECSTPAAFVSGERRGPFWVQLADAIHDLSDARQIVDLAMRLLRDHLDADRCAWAEVEDDEDHFVFIGSASRRGVAPAEGRFPVSAFGRLALPSMRSGCTFSSDDLLAEGGDPETCRITGIRALIANPMHRVGRFVAGIGVHMLSPRVWTADEIQTVREVTNRCFESIERARIERARSLAESDLQFQKRALDEASIVAMTDVRGTITYVNDRFCQISGYSREELVGQNHRIVNRGVHPSSFFKEMYRTIALGHVWRGDICNRRKDGELYWVDTTIVPALEGGKPTRYLAIRNDITARKRAEEALVEADRLKNEFLATLAHELRNPLAPIRTGLELLGSLPPGDTRAQRARTMMDRQVTHLVSLVNDLLDVARISHGKLELHREVLDVRTVVDQAVDASRELLAAHALSLTVTLPDEPLWVEGDSTRLAQIFGNLLHNATKYTPPGGRVEVSMSAEGPNLVAFVRDTGVGIAPERLSQVFTMFTQLERTRDVSHGGLGIGLNLVKRLIEMHGGQIRAESQGPDRGSTFTFSIPLTTSRYAAPSADAPVSTSEEPMQRSKRRPILVVDDNLDAAESLAMILGVMGFDAIVAQDGESALEEAEAHAPSSILLDIGLPGIDGYEVARRLRASSRLRSVHLIALTGWGAEADRQRSREAGFDAHLTKPIDAETLRALLGASRAT